MVSLLADSNSGTRKSPINPALPIEASAELPRLDIATLLGCIWAMNPICTVAALLVPSCTGLVR